MLTASSRAGSATPTRTVASLLTAAAAAAVLSACSNSAATYPNAAEINAKLATVGQACYQNEPSTYPGSLTFGGSLVTATPSGIRITVRVETDDAPGGVVRTQCSEANPLNIFVWPTTEADGKWTSDTCAVVKSQTQDIINKAGDQQQTTAALDPIVNSVVIVGSNWLIAPHDANNWPATFNADAAAKELSGHTSTLATMCDLPAGT